jgi:hypothetical protein
LGYGVEELQLEWIESDEYMVGNYLYRYMYSYPTRQSYGIMMVGYDLINNKKVLIHSSEGTPSITSLAKGPILTYWT